MAGLALINTKAMTQSSVPAIDPVVDGAALHQRISGLELHHNFVVEFHLNLTGDDDRIVYRVCAVIARHDARLVAHDAEHRATLNRGPK